MAIHAFFFPRRELVASTVVRERAIAQAASHNAALTCGLPFTLENT